MKWNDLDKIKPSELGIYLVQREWKEFLMPGINQIVPQAPEFEYWDGEKFTQLNGLPIPGEFFLIFWAVSEFGKG